MSPVVSGRNILMGGGKKMMASWVIDDGPATALTCSYEASTPSMATGKEK